jgi:hypothetical protein
MGGAQLPAGTLLGAIDAKHKMGRELLKVRHCNTEPDGEAGGIKGFDMFNKETELGESVC